MITLTQFQRRVLPRLRLAKSWSLSSCFVNVIHNRSFLETYVENEDVHIVGILRVEVEQVEDLAGLDGSANVDGRVALIGEDLDELAGLHDDHFLAGLTYRREYDFKSSQKTW